MALVVFNFLLVYFGHADASITGLTRQALVTPTIIAATTTAPLISVPGFSLPRPNSVNNSIYNSLMLIIVLLAVVAVAYVIAIYCWGWFGRLRWRWKRAVAYERELKESLVEFGESTGWSEAGSVERAAHSAAKRAGLWWREAEGGSVGRARERGSVRSGGIEV
jgi:hypothetical protein